MTKLEEKLIELGYKMSYDYEEHINAIKFDLDFDCDLVIKIKDNQIIDWYVYSLTRHFKTDTQLVNLQWALEDLQNDLEVLKELC